MYGIQPVGLDGKQEPLVRVEDMASRYIQELQMLQPSGPYYLGGYSLGGILTFEMARRLVTMGEKIAILALLDTYSLQQSPNPITIFKTKFTLLKRRTRIRFQYFTSLPPENRIDYLQQSAKRFTRRIRNRIRELTVDRKQSESALLTDPLRIVRKCNMLAARKYRSVPHNGISYDGHITLFLAAKRETIRSANPVEEWQSLTKGMVQAICVPGDHVTMLREPNVKILGRRLDECLLETNRSLGADRF